MTEKFDSDYAARFIDQHNDVVESWTKSADPLRRALAGMIKTAAGVV